MKSKTTAAILALFLGGFGIHRFYLNQTGLGFLYLLFFWTLIPGVIALIDFIVFLSMSEESFNAKYNSRVVISPMQMAPTNAMNNVNVNFGDSNSSKSSNSDEIKKLYELKEKGIITLEEFEMKKKMLL
jgi:TM2 domain-containing membrane protein YozV